MPDDRDATRITGAWALGFLALFVLAGVIWVRWINTSLWLDETATAWVITGGLPRLMHRAVHFQASPLYYYIPWLAMKVGGASEAALRVPSLIAMAAAAYALWRLGRELFDPPTGAMAALLFVSMKQVAIAASEARPYAVAVLAAVAAMLFLVRWIRRGALADAVGYAVCAALTVYLQVLFALMFLVHVAWLLLSERPGRRVRLRRALWLAAGVAVLLVPFVPQFLSLAERRGMLSWSESVSLWELLQPRGRVMAAFLLGWLLLWLLGRRRGGPRRDAAGGTLWALLAWTLVPPAVLGLVSAFTSYEMYVWRYYLCAMPGFALLLAALLQRLRLVGAARALGMALAAALIFVGTRDVSQNEDWRGVLEAARQSLRAGPAPVLVRAGLIESDQPEWLRDAERRSYLLAPLAFYPLHMPALPLPLHLTPDTESYLDEIGRETLPGVRRFLMIERAGRADGRPIEAKLTSFGYRRTLVGRHGALSLMRFER